MRETGLITPDCTGRPTLVVRQIVDPVTVIDAVAVADDSADEQPPPTSKAHCGLYRA